MRHKINTLCHQHLYDSMNSINSEQFPLIYNKEKDYLLHQYRQIRQDYYSLSKHRSIDCLFSDIILKDKKTICIFEHIVIKGSTIFVLERKKIYANQVKLLQKKVKFLKRVLGKKQDIIPLILTDKKVANKKIYSTLEDFEKLITADSSGIDNKILCENWNSYILNNLVSLDIQEYFRYKHNIDLGKSKPRKRRQSKALEILSSFNRRKVSSLTTLILFIFALNSLLVYSKITGLTHQFYVTAILDVFYCVLLNYTLLYLENKFPKYIKYPILIGFLVAMIFIFGKNIYYFI